MRYKAEDIFTPQGRLEDVEKNPNLDFLMNVFNIPRVFGVSGFGKSWNVGQHSFATALIALKWAQFNGFKPEKRDRLVTQALVHDLHESVTGDILPMFKNKEIKGQLKKLQANILSSLGVTEDISLAVDLKIVDLIAFLYEIQQVSPSILHPKKLELANTIAMKQKELLLHFGRTHKIKVQRIEKFLKILELNT